jgi:hypothetical protein
MAYIVAPSAKRGIKEKPRAVRVIFVPKFFSPEIDMLDTSRKKSKRPVYFKICHDYGPTLYELRPWRNNLLSDSMLA